MSTVSTTVDKKSKTASTEKRKSKQFETKKSRRTSSSSTRHSDGVSVEPSLLKYVLDFGKMTFFY